MSELRQDPTTFDWVIIAQERTKRPKDFIKKGLRKRYVSSYSEDCPFCPGHEDRTPQARAVYGSNDQWNIRVIPNKYPALTPSHDARREEIKLFRKSHGYGRHEVIVETPLHNTCIALMPDEHVEALIGSYRDCYHELKKDSNIKVIILFKNHGEEAGTSLEHPHTQIVASPIVPPLIRRRLEIATQHYDNTGRCLYCDILYDEVEAGERIVKETEYFVALHPFASRYPFETWIMPKLHSSSFGKIMDMEIRDLAGILKNVLLKLFKSLDNPDFNLIIHSTPVDDEHKTYYLWHIQIIPRLSLAAGFELGSGIYINTALPEETAAFMRDLTV